MIFFLCILIFLKIMKNQLFITITTQRSGSTWLMSLLNSHKDLIVFEELFEIFYPKKMHLISNWKDYKYEKNNMIPFYPYKTYKGAKRPLVTFKYLNQIEMQSKRETIGFKLMYNQLEIYPEIWLKIILGNYKIIHLVRENYLDVIISRENAWGKNGNNIVHNKEYTDVKLVPIHLNTSQLISDLYYQENIIKKHKLLLNCLPNKIINITYESLVGDFFTTVNKIVEFLDVEPSSDYRSSFKKDK